MSEESYLTTRGGRQTGAGRSAPRQQRRHGAREEQGIIPVLAKAVMRLDTDLQSL